MDRHESVRVLVDVEELTLLLDELERPVDAVAPAVVLAHELPAEALRLLAWEVVPRQPVAPMPAHVVKRPHRVVAVTHDDDRRVRDIDVLREVAPGLRE